jgi:hypothetical protein
MRSAQRGSSIRKYSTSSFHAMADECVDQSLALILRDVARFRTRGDQFLRLCYRKPVNQSHRKQHTYRYVYAYDAVVFPAHSRQSQAHALQRRLRDVIGEFVRQRRSLLMNSVTHVAAAGGVIAAAPRIHAKFRDRVHGISRAHALL